MLLGGGSSGGGAVEWSQEGLQEHHRQGGCGDLLCLFVAAFIAETM